MSLVENFAAERRARLVRLSTRPKPKPRFEPIDPAPFYPQMWMYDLVEPRPHPKPQPTILHIRGVVCQYFNMRPGDVESKRQGAFVYPRHLAFYLARAYTNYSYPQIARWFSDRDHTTIMHGVRRIQSRLKIEPTVARDVAHLEAML